MLTLHEAKAGYGRVEVLHGIDFSVGAQEIVAIIGANGAGKSTLLKAISGLVKLSSGSIEFDGQRIDSLAAERIVARGLVQIPEGRQLFGALTVDENLELGRYSRRKHGRPKSEKLERVFEMFPLLKERLRQQAGTLSGGEQQMLAIGRALMAEPRLLLLDEPSMGLAPIVVRDIFAGLRRLNEDGLAIVLVEQNAKMALGLASRGLIMERGNIVLEDNSTALLDNPEVRAIYFGQRRGAGYRLLETT